MRYRPLLPNAALCAATLMFPAPGHAQDSTTVDSSRSRGLPLQPATTIRFTTDEGSWISLDVSPDGSFIVFDLLGDLYRLPLTGGEASRITSGMGFDAQPRISPDGQWVAFISDRDGHDNLWVAKTDGSEPRKLSAERQNGVISPTWTPDSKYVIVSRRARRTELRMYHIDGGSGVTVGGSSAPPPSTGTPAPPGPTGPAHLGATMTPDGRYLYFGQSVNNARGRFPLWQIARRDMVTGDVDVITQSEGSAIRPLLSPDGRLLVYGTRYETRTGLRVRDLDTGADRWLVWPVQRDEQESGGSPSRDVLPGYAFTPDGQSVVVTAGGRILSVDVASGATTEIPFTAEVELDVGPALEAPYRVEQGPVRARLVQDPRLSPDGARLAFSVLTKVYVMDLPSGTPRRLTSGDQWEFKPTWSPDGTWIAYVTWAMDGGHIWKVRSDGRGEPVRLSPYEAFYTDITFSPDGLRIVGLRGNQYMRHQTFSEFGGLRIPLDVVWLPAEGGVVKLVAPARGLGAPHFADADERIYVYSRDGLTSMRYDGTDRRTHLKVTAPPNPRSPRPPAAETVLMRPDGRWALASVNNQLHVVAVPVLGGDGPSVAIRSPSVPTARITDIGADYFAWANGGRTITWAIGSTFFQRPFESLSFEPASARGPRGPDAADRDSTTAARPADDDSTVVSTEIVMEFPRRRPEGRIALRGATIVTMNGDTVIPGGDVLIDNNRIAAVGPDGTVPIPDDAEVVDVTGRFIVPGYIDTHAHWEFRTHDVLEPQNWSLIANLAYGVTAGLDVQTSTNDYFAYQDLVETGQSLGQRAFMTGPGIFSSNDFRSYEATRSYLERYHRHYRTPNIKSYMVGNRQQRQWVVQAAHELGLMPTTEGGRDLKLDLTHAIDGFHGNEHTLPVVPLYRDVVQLYAQTRTAYTPTLLVLYGGPIAEEYFYTTTEVHDDPKLNRFYPHNVLDQMSRRRSRWVREDEHSFDEAAAQAAKIQRAGGLVGVGGHGQLQGLGYHWEMWALAMGGMTPREVLRAATIDGARIIGIDQDLGSIEAGKLADLVVLDQNPLEDIRNTTSIRYVMKNGELFDGDTLTQVWPERRELPPFWWWNDAPEDASH